MGVQTAKLLVLQALKYQLLTRALYVPGSSVRGARWQGSVLRDQEPQPVVCAAATRSCPLSHRRGLSAVLLYTPRRSEHTARCPSLFWGKGVCSVERDPRGALGRRLSFYFPVRKLRKRCGSSGCLLRRGALWQPSLRSSPSVSSKPCVAESSTSPALWRLRL